MARTDDPEAEMVREALVCSPDEEGNQTEVNNRVSLPASTRKLTKQREHRLKEKTERRPGVLTGLIAEW